MVDMDKHACCLLADESYENKLWLESYITWEFLEAHPGAMKPGYLTIDWNTIPGVYNWKHHLRMSVAVVRKPSQHDGLPFLTAEEFWDSANETTHTLLLVRLHRKSLLFPNIYYDWYGQHFTLMHDSGKGYWVGVINANV